MDLAQRLAAFEQADLYVVITEAFCAGRTSLMVLDLVLAAGVGLVQLREKDLEGRAFMSWRWNSAGAPRPPGPC